MLVAVVAAPLVYEGWSSSVAAHIAGRLIVWCALGLMAMVFTGRVPSQRLGLLRHEASALARSDALTGLGNRRAFDEALDAAIETGESRRPPAGPHRRRRRLLRCGAAQLERGMNGRELLDRADLQLLAAKGQPATSPPGAA